MKTKKSAAVWKMAGGAGALVVIFGIIIAANVILTNLRLRKDFTEEGLYTLSTGSHQVLNDLDRHVTLKLFFSRSSPDVPVQLKEYATRVEDLLREYRLAADGKISVDIYDPKPDSDAEDWARRYGLNGQTVEMFGPPVYFGLVATCGEAEGVMPWLDRSADQLLEYNITRMIHRVANPKKPVVGVLSSLPVMGRQAPPFAMPGQNTPQSQPAWVAFQDLREDYEVREIPETTDTIDPDLDALIVVHPKELSETTQFAIDQFVLGGGHLLVMVDPLSAADIETSPPRGPYGMNVGASDLAPLLAAWGVGYSPEQVAADMSSASPIRGAGGQVEESPVWLSLTGDSLNQDDLLTAQLELLMFPFAGSLTDQTDDDVSFTPLLTTSEHACTIHARSAQFGGQAVRQAFTDKGVPLNTAVRLHGTFHTAFPDGPPAPEPTDGEEQETEQPESGTNYLQEGQSTIVLIADVDFIYDRFCVRKISFFGTQAYQPANDNLSLFANAVEQMTGAPALIDIRSRGRVQRPFERVQALENKARLEWQSREEALEQKLQQTRQRLSELEGQKDQDQRFILSPEQEKALEKFRRDEAETREQLKNVRKNLRRDIERLGFKLKVLNIALMPLLVALGGIAFYIYRKRKA